MRVLILIRLGQVVFELYITSRPRIFKNKDVLFKSTNLNRDNKHVLKLHLNENMTNIV